MRLLAPKPRANAWLFVIGGETVDAVAPAPCTPWLGAGKSEIDHVGQ